MQVWNKVHIHYHIWFKMTLLLSVQSGCPYKYCHYGTLLTSTLHPVLKHKSTMCQNSTILAHAASHLLSQVYHLMGTTGVTTWIHKALIGQYTFHPTTSFNVCIILHSYGEQDREARSWGSKYLWWSLLVLQMAQEQHERSCFYHGCVHVHVLQSLTCVGGEAIPPWTRMALHPVKQLPHNIQSHACLMNSSTSKPTNWTTPRISTPSLLATRFEHLRLEPQLQVLLIR